MDATIAREPLLCTGCSACAQACKQSAITMAENREGFSYPEIASDKCIDCGVCRRVCPVNSRTGREEGPADWLQVAGRLGKSVKTYACYASDRDVRQKSSSGGVFSMLAEAVLSDGGVVFGAAFDENFKVRHKGVENKKDLDSLRRSKYVQSDMGNTYREAEAFLKQSRRVMYCGTPCQIAGLDAYLGKSRGKLLTCDLACYGVPSPKVWGMFLDYLKGRYKSGIKAVSFRDKSEGWSDSSMSIDFDNGSRYRVRINKETYLKGYFKKVFNRSSCFNCPFRIQNTGADITLADFWGIEGLGDADFTDNKGVSLAIAHTEQGKAAMLEISGSLRISEKSLEDALKGNPRLFSSDTEPRGRKAFFDDLQSGWDFERLRRKYMDNSSLKYRLKCLVKFVLRRT